jgi:hypothetical protein
VRYTAAPAAGTRRQRGLRGLPVAGPLAVVLVKDMRTLVRDARWRNGTLIGLVALVAPAVLFSAGAETGPRDASDLRFWVALFPIPYIAYLLGSQHGAATLAYEGRNIALLRSSPIGLGRLLFAKLMGSLGLVLLITWLATAVLSVRHGGGAAELGLAMLAATWLACGGTAAGVIGASLTVDFDMDNPQRRVGWFGTLLTSGLSALFFGANVLLLAWVILRAAGGVPRFLSFARPVLDVGLPALAVVSIGALLLAARFGIKRLSAWEATTGSS